MRNTHMEIMDIIMANLTSPVARMDAGSTKVSDQINTAPAVCTNTICDVSSAVACDNGINHAHKQGKAKLYHKRKYQF